MGRKVLIDKRLYKRALQPFKDSGMKMEDFRLTDEARELLGIKLPSQWDLVLNDNPHAAIIASARNYADDILLEKRMTELEPEIQKALAGCTPEELSESCERVRRYWRLIDIQQAASAAKEER